MASAHLVAIDLMGRYQVAGSTLVRYLQFIFIYFNVLVCSPPARWGLLDFIRTSFLLPLPPSFFLLLLAKHHLPPRECSKTRQTSSASSWSPCVSPDFICRLAGLHLPVLIAVGLVGLLQCDSICGPRRTFTARKSLWASLDFWRLEKTQKECQI